MSIMRSLHNASVTEGDATNFVLWAFEPDYELPFQNIWLFKGSEEPIELDACTFAHQSGADETRIVRWPDDATAQISQLVPFFQHIALAARS
jgi:hypothetical protein